LFFRKRQGLGTAFFFLIVIKGKKPQRGRPQFLKKRWRNSYIIKLTLGGEGREGVIAYPFFLEEKKRTSKMVKREEEKGKEMEVHLQQINNLKRENLLHTPDMKEGGG